MLVAHHLVDHRGPIRAIDELGVVRAQALDDMPAVRKQVGNDVRAPDA